MVHLCLQNRAARYPVPGASPRGGLGWTCPPNFCQRLFLPEIDANPVSLGREGRKKLLWFSGVSTPHFLTWRRPRDAPGDTWSTAAFRSPTSPVDNTFTLRQSTLPTVPRYRRSTIRRSDPLCCQSNGMDLAAGRSP